MAIPEDDLLGVRDWRDDPRFGPPERAVLAATNEIVQQGWVSVPTWDLLVEHLPRGDDQPQFLLEAITAMGAWRMVSSMVSSLDVPLEDGVEPRPPDGLSPPGPTPG